MNKFEELVEKTKSIIIEQVNTTGMYRCATCDAPNWNRDEHEAHNAIKRKGIDGLQINSKVNFGVTDWVIIKN